MNIFERMDKGNGNHKTGNESGLPIQNRNLAVALLEMDLAKINQ